MFIKTNILLILLISGFATAADTKNFDDRKARILTEIDKRIVTMQEHKNCISNAQDKDALKTCRNSAISARDAKREERRAEREERRAEREKL